MKVDRPNLLKILNYIELVCMVWFTFEFFIRIWSCPNKKKFFIDILNIIDLLTILPFYVGLFFTKYERYNNIQQILRVLKMLRILRIFKLVRHSGSLRAMASTFTRSYQELTIMMMQLAVNCLLFASLTYFAEHEEPDTKFTSILSSMWYIFFCTVYTN